LISKGKKIRAVLITPEAFQRRFLDIQAREEKERFLDRLKAMRANKVTPEDSVATLRRLRGYDACYAALAKDLKGCWLTFDGKAHRCIQQLRLSCDLSEQLPPGWD
jgi:predicted nucleic acid-binding protein